MQARAWRRPPSSRSCSARWSVCLQGAQRRSCVTARAWSGRQTLRPSSNPKSPPAPPSRCRTTAIWRATMGGTRCALQRFGQAPWAVQAVIAIPSVILLPQELRYLRVTVPWLPPWGLQGAHCSKLAAIRDI
eukprot:1161553-Pelagomonas_calceolata.AAC.5